MTLFRPLTVTLALIIGVSGCNDAPAGLEIAIGPAQPTTESDIELTYTATAVDEQGHDVRYDIGWTVDGNPSALHDGLMVIPQADTAKGQVWSATVTPVDEKDEAGESKTASVTVVNTAPRGATLELAPGLPTTSDDLSVTVSGQEDPDGDALTLAYLWSVDGASAGTEAQLPSSNFAKGQQVQVAVTVSDDETSTDFLSAVLTIGNTAPTLTQVQASPAAPRVDEAITCSPTDGADIDGDPLTYRYAWYVNGRTLTGETGSELLTGYQKEQIVACEATVTDGAADGPTVRSNDVTVVNSPAELASVTISPVAPTTVDDLRATVSRVLDADGDAVTLSFTWSINGVPLRTDTTVDLTTTLAADQFSRDDVVSVEVSGDDGDIAGDAVTDSITVANTAPVVDGVFLDPVAPVTDTDVIATANASDADLDALTYTYTWYIDSVAQSETSDTLSSSGFSKGDDVSVDVVASDGDLSSATVSSTTLTIQNSPPSAPVISLTPTEPSSTDDLVCTVTTASTDKDLDSVQYVTTWVLDGSDFSTVTTSATSSTLSSTELTDGDEWSCEVAATDGTDLSATVVSDTVDVLDWGGPRTFTSCGTTGRVGPTSSACSTAYSGTDLASELSVTSGIQAWTVPATGSYVIEAYGAQGGGPRGGQGAYLKSTHSLTAGETIYVLVGQRGGLTDQGDYCAGGGGGTYVYRKATDTAPLMAAAGGGGQYESGPGAEGSHTATTTTPTSGTGAGAGGTGGNGGDGGKNVGSLSTAGGGGGWISDGKDGLTLRYAKGIGGQAPRNGAVGGLYSHTYYNDADGGFGGGGGASDNSGAGGGGGGYNGGGGGNNYTGGGTWDGGGGGGSYNGGSSTSGTTGTRSGEGQVIIDRVAP